jgi:hypothetical protein
MEARTALSEAFGGGGNGLGAARFHLAQKNGWVPWHFGLSAMAAFKRQSGSVTGSLGWTNGTMIVLRGLVWAR